MLRGTNLFSHIQSRMSAGTEVQSYNNTKGFGLLQSSSNNAHGTLRNLKNTIVCGKSVCGTIEEPKDEYAIGGKI